MKLPRALARVAGLLVLAVAAAEQHDAPGSEMVLAGGPSLLAAIGDAVPEAAASLGMSVERFKAASRDSDFRYDLASGDAHYVCRGLFRTPRATQARAAGSGFQLSLADADAPRPASPAAAPAAPPPSNSGPGDAGPSDLSQAFKLHSRPGAPRVILLDFTGYTTTNTRWNGSRNVTTITTPPYDTDGKPSSFSEDELQVIIQVWRRVSEDYAPFDVDVTTEDDDGAGKPLNLTDYGIRAAIGGLETDWYKCDCAGTALVNSFGRPSTHGPCFVFAGNNDSPKSIAEAVSHEVGHTLGLSHDGQTSPVDRYYEGHKQWSTIMGASYYTPLSQWSKGEYPLANNKEDDLSIMTDPSTVMQAVAGRLAYRPDDHGDSPDKATALAGAGVDGDGPISRLRATAAGLIGKTGDVDHFRIHARGRAGAGIPGVLKRPLENLGRGPRHHQPRRRGDDFQACGRPKPGAGGHHQPPGRNPVGQLHSRAAVHRQLLNRRGRRRRRRRGHHGLQQLRLPGALQDDADVAQVCA